jgi:hypothetical protein
MKPHHRLITLGISLSIGLTGTGCGVLVGNIKPVSEKSDDYQVKDLSRQDSDWVKLPPQENSNESDVAYQSKSSGALISLNTSCRELNRTQSLQAVSDLLFLGISDIEEKKEKSLMIQDSPALETTVTGKLNQEPTKIRATVIKKDRCIYDVLYVTRPKSFSSKEGDYSAFVHSLRLE